MAAVAMDMKADMLLPYLPVILPPLLRDSSEKSTTSGSYPYHLIISGQRLDNLSLESNVVNMAFRDVALWGYICVQKL